MKEPKNIEAAAQPDLLPQTIVGAIFILNSFLVKCLFDHGEAVGALSALVGTLILGGPILLASLRSLSRGGVSINELASLAILASFALGDYQTSGVVAFFMLLGRVIETRTAAGGKASIEALIHLTPTRARRIMPRGEEEIPATQLTPGDLIRARPGDNIPADGVIAHGLSLVNQANITGESLPREKKPGDEVFAGTQNITGVLEIRVTKAGENTTLGRVRELIHAAERTRLPIMRIMDEYARHYTPLVLIVAALVWTFTHDLQRVVAIIVIACPGAFILATPTAMVAALSAAARLGILIKNVGDIELIARINAFIFDKTGTLTTGRLAVSRLAPLGKTSPAELLRAAASAERHSNHPAARALAQLASEAGVPLVEPGDFSETAGRGIQAAVEGASVLVGRAQWLRDQGVPDDFSSGIDLDETQGYSLIFVSQNGRCIGWVGLQDKTREDAAPALAALRQEGVRRIAMFTGDRRPVAERVAKQIGCAEVISECLPQDKVEFVQGMKAKGYRVAVVGDGVNDAPALAAGNVGIAMGAAGSDVAIHSATIALMNNDLSRLPFAVRLSRNTRRIINQNFFIGILFILGGLALATFGYLTPIVAAVLYNLGSLLVVFNSGRLVRQGEEFEPFVGPPPAEQRNRTDQANMSHSFTAPAVK